MVRNVDLISAPIFANPLSVKSKGNFLVQEDSKLILRVLISLKHPFSRPHRTFQFIAKLDLETLKALLLEVEKTPDPP